MNQENESPAQFAAAYFGQPTYLRTRQVFPAYHPPGPLMPTVGQPPYLHTRQAFPAYYPPGPLIPTVSYTSATPSSTFLVSRQSNTVTIAYDLGRRSALVDRETLCSQSAWFARALSSTWRIRLRNDFPFAVKAMLDFFAIGFYNGRPEMVDRYPLVTNLDLHVQVYVVSVKYEVPALGDFATSRFLDIASAIMAMDITHDNPDVFTRPFSLEYGSAQHINLYTIYEDSTATPHHVEPDMSPHDPRDYSPAAHIDHLLNAITLLWKHTARNDALRKQVIELVKLGLHKLMQLKFFVTLLADMEDFGTEIVQSLREDGFEVRIERLGWVGSRCVPLRWEAPGNSHE